MAEYRQLVRTADAAYLGERELTMCPIDICYRHEQQQIVVCLVELGLTGKAGIRGVIEAKVSKVFSQRARPLIDCGRNHALLLSRKRR